MWLTLLSSRWVHYAAILLICGTVVGVLRVDLRLKDAKISELSTTIVARDKSIGELRAAISQYQASVEQQNAAVEGWKAAAVKQDQLRVASEKRAAALLAKSAESARSILQSPIELLPADAPECSHDKGAIQWLNSQSQSLRASW